jgi:SOS-response transcriptional repressor LexA
MAARIRKARAPRKRARFRNDNFLKVFGEHCKRLRLSRGLSIDRFAKESEQLSPSVVHRLESASGAVTVTAMIRYAEVLGLHPKDLLDFPWTEEPKDRPAPAKTERGRLRSLNQKMKRVVGPEDPAIRRKEFHSFVPLYTLKAAAGGFSDTQEVEPEGWVELTEPAGGDRQLFVARVMGKSMEPRIRSGDYCLFRSNPPGTRQGKVVLVQYRGEADPETGGSYTVKYYTSANVQKGGKGRKQITLSPFNPEFEAMVLNPEDPGEFRVVAELIDVLSK